LNRVLNHQAAKRHFHSIIVAVLNGGEGLFLAAKTLCHGSVADPYLGVPPCQPMGFSVLSLSRIWSLPPYEIHDTLGLTNFFFSFDP